MMFVLPLSLCSRRFRHYRSLLWSLLLYLLGVFAGIEVRNVACKYSTIHLPLCPLWGGSHVTFVRPSRWVVSILCNFCHSFPLLAVHRCPFEISLTLSLHLKFGIHLLLPASSVFYVSLSVSPHSFSVCSTVVLYCMFYTQFVSALMHYIQLLQLQSHDYI